MTQVFSRSADTWLRLGLLGVFVGLAGSLVVALIIDRSDYRTGRGRVPSSLCP